MKPFLWAAMFVAGLLLLLVLAFLVGPPLWVAQLVSLGVAAVAFLTFPWWASPRRPVFAVEYRNIVPENGSVLLVRHKSGSRAAKEFALDAAREMARKFRDERRNVLVVVAAEGTLDLVQLDDARMNDLGWVRKDVALGMRVVTCPK